MPQPMDLEKLREKVSESLRQFVDFPQPGIIFEDILPIFRDTELHAQLVNGLAKYCLDYIKSSGCSTVKIDAVVALEARGFLIGPSLALALNAAFVPVRKPGKLPGECETVSYNKEYGSDVFQVQRNAILRGWKCVVIDDLLATGGSASAAGSLIRKSGGIVMEYIFLVELCALHGRTQLTDAPVFALLQK